MAEEEEEEQREKEDVVKMAMGRKKKKGMRRSRNTARISVSQQDGPPPFGASTLAIIPEDIHPP